DNRDGNVYYF
nr:Chain B, DNRDGNVYYF peptide [synthetic construct]